MAKRKIVISEHENIAALMEEDRAVEFIIHRGDMLLGDVYLATVENILPSIDAAFVNVGGDKMGFLHSSDVPGKGDLKDRLEPKQQLVVQIMKEPTGHKGPRVSTNISLPGRFLVMMPESKGISISRKIVETAERSRLKSIVSLIKPPGVGVIIRTEANEQKESDITEDFETLIERWQNIVSMADTAKPPTLLYRDQDLLYRVIRESVTEDVTEIIVDSAFGQQRAQQLLQNWNMDRNIKVAHHQGNQPILVGCGVDKEIRLALNTKVPLPSGGYLYIQPTEALTVIDVNSGKFTSLQSQAETIKLTNLEACREIARQLRLRNIGGIIIVDFIDMESRANQLSVLQTFENELAPDKSKPQIGQLSDLGLVEMTRHRQGQSLSEIFTRRCSTCSGTGHALDELSWVQTGGDEGRGGRHMGRNKLPMRQPMRTQPLPKPAASLTNRKDKPRVTLAGMMNGGRNDEQGQGDDKSKLQPRVQPGNILLAELAGKRQQETQGLSEQLNMLERMNDQIHKSFGVRLAESAKLAFLPPIVNNTLSRINPKANDVVSLVQSIESAGSLPMPPLHDAGYRSGYRHDRLGFEDDGDDAENDESDFNPEFNKADLDGDDETVETIAGRDGRANGRANRQRQQEDSRSGGRGRGGRGRDRNLPASSSVLPENENDFDDADDTLSAVGSSSRAGNFDESSRPSSRAGRLRNAEPAARDSRASETLDDDLDPDDADFDNMDLENSEPAYDEAAAPEEKPRRGRTAAVRKGIRRPTRAAAQATGGSSIEDETFDENALDHDPDDHEDGAAIAVADKNAPKRRPGRPPKRTLKKSASPPKRG